MAISHYYSMAIISVGSFISGILPITFTFRATRFYPFFLSLILCLGAGVLLATSIVHMLTEIQEKLQGTAQLYFCSGFFILYALDEIIHFFLEGKRLQVHTHSDTLIRTRPQRSSYGATNGYNCAPSVNSPLLASTGSIIKPENVNEIDSLHQNTNCGTYNNLRYEKSASRQNESENCSNSNNAYNDQLHCHVEIGEPCSSNPIAKVGLLIALTIHSILESISIGIQTEFNEIFLLLGTVSFHKIVLSFCLGLELHSHGLKNLYLILAILVFSLGSSLGIFIGMCVMSTNSVFNIDAQMQAIAAGSLLYVAAFEVLPRERFRWQHNSTRRSAGIFQLLFVILGFFCITSIHLFLDTSHNHAQGMKEP